jgi:hypothetical protein
VNVTTIPSAPSRITPSNSKRTRCWEEMETASPFTSLRSSSISRSLELHQVAPKRISFYSRVLEVIP